MENVTYPAGWFDPPEESPHHEDCPQHPWNDVFETREACECEQLQREDVSGANEDRCDVRRKEEGMMIGFQAPPHYFAGVMAQDFAAVVKQAARKNARTFSNELVALAILGAEHSRLCLPKDTIRRRKRK